MGCWNETCFLSNLPIVDSDEVKVFILMESKEIKSKPCCHTDNYVPICLPFDAKYNEYGGVKEVVVSEHTEYLINNLAIINSDGTKYIYKSMEQFIEDIIRGTIKMRHAFDERTLTVAYAHKRIYNQITVYSKITVPQNANKNLQSCLIEKYDDIKKYIVDLYKLENSRDTMDMYYHQQKRDFIKDNLYGTGYTNSIYFPCWTLLSSVHILETMLDDFITEFIDFIAFDMALAKSRIGYLSISGAGSQSTSIAIQKIIAEFILEHSKAVDNDGNKIYDNELEYYWFDK